LIVRIIFEVVCESKVCLIMQFLYAWEKHNVNVLWIRKNPLQIINRES
jgi:hypothetical protein